MFGRKKESIAASSPTVGITSIPSEFYGGSNPVVKFKDVKKVVDLSMLSGQSVTPADKKLHDKQTAAGGGEAIHPVALLSNRRFLIIGGIIIFLVALVVTSAVYLMPYFKKLKPAPRPPEIEIQTPTSTAIITPTSSIIITPVTSTLSTTTVRDAKIELPSILLGDSEDGDNDGLSDREEEEVFTTDLGVPDTDNDTYQDGHEAYYLYNPTGKEPEKLLDSGLVKNYENPVWHYQIFFPLKWAVGNIDNDYREMLWSTITGENIELRVIDRKPGQTFDNWFAEWAPQEKFSDLTEFQSYYKVPGFRRTDYLVYYFPTPSKVYILLYHPSIGSSVVNYRMVIKMMARSLRLSQEANTSFPQDLILITTTSTTSSSGASPAWPSISITSTTSSVLTSSSSPPRVIFPLASTTFSAPASSASTSVSSTRR